MLALIITLLIAPSADPVVVDDDVDIIETLQFDMPLDIPRYLVLELQTVKLYVSKDQGASWGLVNDFNPYRKEVHYSAQKDGLYWFTIQRVYKNGKTEPAEEFFYPMVKVYVNYLKNKVMKKDDLVNENRALKRTIDDLKRKVEDLETKNKDSVTPVAENVEVYYYRPKHLLRRTRY